MAKGNKTSPLVLGGICIALASGGWLMRMFPILIFFGIAPLFALTDRAVEAKKHSPWNYIELILLALAISLFAAHFFETEAILFTLLQAIILSLAFAGYTFARIELSPQLSKIVLLLYWLTAEYLFLKIGPSNFVFLADAVQLKQDWYRWNTHTGYLGASLWILLCNLMIYSAVLKGKKINWSYLISFILLFAVPLLYSTKSNQSVITRAQMIDLYSNTSTDITYATRGEYIARTSAWISLLIILFTLVKRKTRRS